MRPQVRSHFAIFFEDALHAAQRRQDVTQKALAKQIAALEVSRRNMPHGLAREHAVASASQRWEKRISAWKRGSQLPDHQGDLLLARAIIDPDGDSHRWVQVWEQDRSSTTQRAANSDSLGSRDEAIPVSASSQPAQRDLVHGQQTTRWRPSLDGMGLTALVHLADQRMDHPGFRKRQITPGLGSPPEIRIGAVLPCQALPENTPSTTALRAAIREFLANSAIERMLRSITHLPPGATWISRTGTGRLSLEAVLTYPGCSDEVPVAWARLNLPEPGTVNPFRDGETATFILCTEPRTRTGSPARRRPLPAWPERFRMALEIPGLLAEFLSHDLALAIAGQQSPLAGIWLTPPGSLVSSAGCTVLPGSSVSPRYNGWAVADREGLTPERAGQQMVQQMCDYHLHLDGYESILRGPPRKTLSRS